MTAEQERAAVVALLESMMKKVVEKPQPRDWPKGAWLARQVALNNHFHFAINAIERGDHHK